jgi:hypothetical protein
MYRSVTAMDLRGIPNLSLHSAILKLQLAALLRIADAAIRHEEKAGTANMVMA